jgi:predicted RNA-binding Zn ribbon-like protein
MSEMAPRVSPPYHERDSTPSAPGDLELIRSFASLHDHVPPSPESLPPGSDTIVWWLHAYGGLPADAEPAARDVAWAAAVLEALRARVGENEGVPRDRAAIRVLDEAAREAGLEVRFGEDALRPDALGVRGAIGRVLAAAFLAELDGSWSRFRRCSNPACRSVFWDRSKNHSGRWCSMQACGNQAKVRAYRRRERAAAP